MKIYNVGHEELDDYDLEYLDKEAYEYLIYNYHYEEYEGDGVALLKDNNGKFMLIYLGHCSCYGPLEECNPKCIYSLEEITKLLDNRRQDSYDRKYAEDVAKKFKELEGLDHENS